MRRGIDAEVRAEAARRAVGTQGTDNRGGYTRRADVVGAQGRDEEAQDWGESEHRRSGAEVQGRGCAGQWARRAEMQCRGRGADVGAQSRQQESRGGQKGEKYGSILRGTRGSGSTLLASKKSGKSLKESRGQRSETPCTVRIVDRRGTNLPHAVKAVAEQFRRQQFKSER